MNSFIIISFFFFFFFFFFFRSQPDDRRRWPKEATNDLGKHGSQQSLRQEMKSKQ
jgi:hypothetical protein